MLQAAMELNPSANWEREYTSILSDMFSLSSGESGAQLFDLFVGAEDAYFENLEKYDPYSADISLEPLVSDKTGDPVYILNQMTKEGMKKYLTAVDKLIADSEHLKDKLGNKSLMEKVSRCLKNTRKDILFSLNH